MGERNKWGISNKLNVSKKKMFTFFSLFRPIEPFSEVWHSTYGTLLYSIFSVILILSLSTLQTCNLGYSWKVFVIVSTVGTPVLIMYRLQLLNVNPSPHYKLSARASYLSHTRGGNGEVADVKGEMLSKVDECERTLRSTSAADTDSQVA